MQPILYATQCNLNFEASFAGIHEILREMWLFERRFQAKNFGQL